MNFTQNKATLFGGAVYVVDVSKIHGQDLNFTHNTATSGSAIYGILSSELLCEDCLFKHNNIDKNEKGAAVIRIQKKSMLNVTGLRCERQTGNFLSCIFASNYCNVSVYNSTFTLNTGSVISMWNNSILFVDNSLFLKNSAPMTGGAIYSWNSILVILNSDFYYNKADEKGGGLCLEFSEAIINNCIFYNDSNGAVAVSSNANISIEDCTFKHNLSPDLGGALNTREYCNLNISNTTFLHNFAVNGDAVSVERYSVVKTLNCSFSDNAALLPTNISNPITGAGGAMFLLKSMLEINQSQFSSNYAVTQGGSVSASESSIYVHGTGFQTNTAGSYGGVITGTNYSSITVEDSLFINNSVPDKTVQSR